MHVRYHRPFYNILDLTVKVTRPRAFRSHDIGRIDILGKEIEVGYLNGFYSWCTKTCDTRNMERDDSGSKIVDPIRRLSHLSEDSQTLRILVQVDCKCSAFSPASVCSQFGSRFEDWSAIATTRSLPKRRHQGYSVHPSYVLGQENAAGATRFLSILLKCPFHLTGEAEDRGRTMDTAQKAHSDTNPAI